MKELDILANNILSVGTVINRYDAVNENNAPVNAVEIRYGKDVVIMIFDSRNICTGIITNN